MQHQYHTEKKSEAKNSKFCTNPHPKLRPKNYKLTNSQEQSTAQQNKQNTPSVQIHTQNSDQKITSPQTPKHRALHSRTSKIHHPNHKQYLSPTARSRAPTIDPKHQSKQAENQAKSYAKNPRRNR